MRTVVQQAILILQENHLDKPVTRKRISRMTGLPLKQVVSAITKSMELQMLMINYSIGVQHPVEVFVPIPLEEFLGMYEISNFGRVKSLGRVIEGGMGIRTLKEKILKAHMSSFYMGVKLSNAGHRRHCNIAVLMAMGFLDHKPTGEYSGFVVDHKDNIKTNDLLYNLQVITNRKNCSKDRGVGTSKYVGVSKTVDGRFQAGIHIKGKRIHLGRFLDEELAHKAYQDKLLTL